jgi:hypothetical protein
MSIDELSIDFTYNGENDTRIYNPETGSIPWMMTAGGNTKLMTALSNYVPLKYVRWRLQSYVGGVWTRR